MKKSFWRLGGAAAFAFLLVQSSLAQKLVDPDSVAPAFRAAAEKRRAEQLKLNDCTKKASKLAARNFYRSGSRLALPSAAAWLRPVLSC